MLGEPGILGREFEFLLVVDLSLCELQLPLGQRSDVKQTTSERKLTDIAHAGAIEFVDPLKRVGHESLNNHRQLRIHF